MCNRTKLGREGAVGRGSRSERGAIDDGVDVTTGLGMAELRPCSAARSEGGGGEGNARGNNERFSDEGGRERDEDEGRGSAGGGAGGGTETSASVR